MAATLKPFLDLEEQLVKIQSKAQQRPIRFLIFIFSALGASFTNSIHVLMLMRFLQGIGIGAANVLCRAILKDLYEGKELAKRTVILGMVWITSPIIAPVIGGYIEEYSGWKMNFVFLAIFVAIMFFCCFIFLPETKDPKHIHSIHPRTILKNYTTLVANRSYMGYVLADFFVYGIFSTFYAVGPFLLQNKLGLSPVTFGWTMLFISSGYLIGSFVNMRLLKHHHVHQLIKVGVTIILFASLCMIALSLLGEFNVPSIALPLLLLFFGNAFIFTNCIGACLSIFPHLAGNASAGWGFFCFLGGTLAITVMTRVHETTALPFSIALFVLALGVFLVLAWSRALRSGNKT